jgi:hypothetical protein
MISKIRLVFGIILTVVFFSLLAVFITPSKHYKYLIKIPNGSHGSEYQTNNYIIENNCIIFKNECGCKDKKTIRICGNYTIITK